MTTCTRHASYGLQLAPRPRARECATSASLSGNCGSSGTISGRPATRQFCRVPRSIRHICKNCSCADRRAGRAPAAAAGLLLPICASIRVPMKITRVEALYLRQPNVKEQADSGQDALIVRVETDAGIVGLG